MLRDDCGSSAQRGNTVQKPDLCGSFMLGGSKYDLDCLTSLDEMAAIADEWRALERCCGLPFIYFQSFDWCFQWSRMALQTHQLDEDTGLRIYTLRRGGEIVMIWPMVRVKSRAGVRLLTFLSEPLGQYGNVITDPARLPIEAGRKAWSLIRKCADVGAITLNQFPHASFLDNVLEGAGFYEWLQKESALLDLTAFGSWDEYHSSLSRNRRKQRNRRRSKLEREGEIGYEVHYGGSAEYRGLVRRALEMKKVWLEETGRCNLALTREGSDSFLLSLNGKPDGEGGLPEGALAQALTLDGKPIGIEMGMCLDGHYYSYLGAFDWAWRSFSPGKVQIEAAQKWAKEAGLRKFDFLGDPSEYKSRWTETSHSLKSCSVPVTMTGYAYCWAWKAYLRPVAKKVYAGMHAGLRDRILRLFGAGKKATAQLTQNNQNGQKAYAGKAAKPGKLNLSADR